MVTKQVEEKRGRGRPSNFPGVKTATRLYKLPEDSIAMIEKLAELRGQPLGVVLDAMIRRAFNESNRKRTARKTEAVAS